MSEPELRALTADREQTQARIQDIHAELAAVHAAAANSNVDDEHDPEGSTTAFERAQLESLLAQAMRHLEDIDAALQRVQRGTYGTCETCGGPIAGVRLQALPAARQCILCAART
ncbi:MAG: TraR/DksA C4-type zinc finger protein [Actinomycetota bacterium]|nr:TraR/DksA C4-type zinc finger protein [Actinomycetota bacterium]